MILERLKLEEMQEQPFLVNFLKKSSDKTVIKST